MASPPLPTPASPDRVFANLSMTEFVIMMALAQAMQALAIDSMLPALGIIARDLGASDPNQRQLIVGIYLIGIAIGSLFPGSFADRFGRRPVLLSCLVSYVVLAIASALVTSFPAMIAVRLMQAIGCGGLAVLPAAIIRDKFEGDRMARLQSLIGMIFLIVPMIAPTIGQGVLLVAGWRWIFGLMAAIGALVTAWVWLRLPETLHPEFRQSVHLGRIARNMGVALTTRQSIGYILGSSLILGAMWGYIQSSQQLIAEHFGAGASFPLVFGGMALFMSLANFTNSRIVERFGARRVSHTALLVNIVNCSIMAWFAYSPHESLWQFVPLMTVAMCMMGFIGANFASIAIQPFAEIAGAAASAQAFTRLMIGSLLAAVVGQAYDDSARPLAWAMLGASVVSLLLVLFSERGRLFRRLYPRGAERPG